MKIRDEASMTGEWAITCEVGCMIGDAGWCRRRGWNAADHPAFVLTWTVSVVGGGTLIFII
jgi:hypothetical protein